MNGRTSTTEVQLNKAKKAWDEALWVELSCLLRTPHLKIENKNNQVPTESGKQIKEGRLKMAKSHQNLQESPLGQRALSALFQHAAQLAGRGAADSQLVKAVAKQVYAKLGGSGSDVFSGASLVAAQTFLNTDMLSRIVARKFHLPEDIVRRLSNESLDASLRGFMEAAGNVDQALPVDQQDQQLRHLADKEFDAYAQKIVDKNPGLLREVILVPEHNRLAIHEVDCTFASASLKNNDAGVKKVRAVNIPTAASPAVCDCHGALTFKGRLYDVIDHLRRNGHGDIVDRLNKELAHDSYQEVSEQFWSRASVYDQATVGMLEEALLQTDPRQRRIRVLCLVGMTPKSGAEGLAASAADQAKKIGKELVDPNSPTHQKITEALAKVSRSVESAAAALRRRPKS